ncbi:hypothetical protein [Agrococcus sp. ARC_14]|uniref:hypothetical protein n=1 Tax=Agrococcus sp. ARC_14 TaxID=2919927 RepID=UPI001F05BF2F|nr:hypothetical protein [Agrococcus sp. ARC_14]MCH1881852.1 hypothetical protein [Agrococcus sp. ARC_14]
MRRHDLLGLGLFLAGLALAYLAFFLLGARVFPAAASARADEMTFASAYFFGERGTSFSELAIVVAWIVLGAVGAVCTRCGYRLITSADDSVVVARSTIPPRHVDLEGWARH